MHAELVFGHGVIVNRKTVSKIMRQHSLPGMKKRFRSKSELATTADLVKRQFARPAPDQLWVTDITEHPTREGKIYCCVILDVFFRRVVGWSIDSHQANPLVTNALARLGSPPTLGRRDRCTRHNCRDRYGLGY